MIIDEVIKWLQHPFYMVLAGMLVWFTFKWSRARNKGEAEGWLGREKDEILFTALISMVALVWDDEALQTFYWVYDYFSGTDVPPEGRPEELEPFYYFLVAPIVDWIYKMFK